MSITNLLVPSCTQMLGALSNWLAKAQAQKSETGAADILSARLAPDMFPLSTQIRFACVQVHEAIFRLQDKDFHKPIYEMREEGLNADEHPGSLADAQARISETIALLNTLAPHTLDVDANKPIVHELANGMVLDLSAEQYARDWALPQFYFHVMTAYSILRSENVELGKADYAVHMLQYVRPETMPKS